jgi:hypothetical protein
LFYTPSSKLSNWKALLAEPQKQWVRKYSAFELAHAWTSNDTFPENVQSLLNNSEYESLHNLEIVLKIPEHKVELDTGKAPSQNDLFVLARTDTDLVTIVVEGKVKEPFGPKVEDWLIEASSGKHNRLNFLMKCLKLNELENVKSIRYQLLHRTASAIIEAEKYHAKHAIMLVQSFCQEYSSLEEYKAFLKLYNLQGDKNQISGPIVINGVNLYLGWISDKLATDLEVIWQAILSHEGETFVQIQGGQFTYQVRGKYIVPDRTNVQISKKSIEEALSFYPFPNTSVIQHLRAPSYIYAILMDNRIKLSLQRGSDRCDLG